MSIKVKESNCVYTFLLKRDLNFWDTLTMMFRILGFHIGGYEDIYLLEYNAMQSVQSQPTFRRNIWLPSSRSKNKLSKKPELCLPPAFTLIPCLVYSSILKVEVTCSSKMSSDFQRIMQRYIPEDRNLLH
jgi:hypothetical protein